MIAASLGDADCFTAIFERHFAMIYAFVARRIGRDLADDLGATVFVEAFASRARFDVSRADARPWLYGIATNLIRRHRRTEARRLRAYARSAGTSFSEPIEVEGRVDAGAMRPQIAEALRSLAGVDRDALLLFAWAGLSYDDIATATNVPVGTVRSRIHRARQRLRAQLRCARLDREHGMTDRDLELLRDWWPEPAVAPTEAQDLALSRLEEAYRGDTRRTVPGLSGRRFGTRIAIAALAVTVLLAGALVWAQRELDDRVASIRTVTVPNGALGSGEVGHGPVNILLVGSDQRDGTDPEAFGNAAETGLPRSDTIVLLRVDGTNVRGLWIPRDLFVGTERINTTFERGPGALIETIKNELGVTVDHYVEVQFSGFQQIVDDLGGVSIYSPGHARDGVSGVDLTGPGCRTLDGAAALSWVRSRHLEIEQNGTWIDASPRADLDRQARQQDFMLSLARTAKTKISDDPVAAVRLVDALIPSLTMDSTFDRAEIIGLVRALIDTDPSTMQFSTLPVEPRTDNATLAIREPDAAAALAAFRNDPAPNSAPPGLPSAPSPSPPTTCARG